MPLTSADGGSQPSADLPYSPAESGDYWFRHLIEGRGNTIREGRVQAVYLQRNFKPPKAQRPWELELSGRMLSIASDIRIKADAAAARAGAISQPPREFHFHHITYENVQNLLNHGSLAVFIEPIPDDSAHANLVIPRLPAPEVSPIPTNKKQTHQIYREISLLLKICGADDLTPFKSLRQQ